ncbi:hypothetical protein DVH05_027420 [Phytophthora capsici]|nr:hypothetical protein DVH05_027420 [Phytophthora capsici]
MVLYTICFFNGKNNNYLQLGRLTCATSIALSSTKIEKAVPEALPFSDAPTTKVHAILLSHLSRVHIVTRPLPLFYWCRLGSTSWRSCRYSLPVRPTRQLDTPAYIATGGSTFVRHEEEGWISLEPYEIKTIRFTTGSSHSTVIQANSLVQFISDEENKLHVGETSNLRTTRTSAT